MFCSNCGRQISDGARFCPHCGYAQEGPVVGQNGNAAGGFSVQAPEGGQSGWDNNGAPSWGIPETKPHSMKWFKFVIYVQLFLTAVSFFVMAITYFTGTIYESTGSSARLVYIFYPGLKGTDLFYGFCLMALAIAAIVVRMMLAKYKKNAPTMYLLLMIASQCASLLYTVLASAITESWSTMPLQIGAIIGTVVYAASNSVYFTKRADLFVN